MVRNGRKIKIHVDDAAKEWLAQAGYSREFWRMIYFGRVPFFLFFSFKLINSDETAIYGARPLARVIQAELLNPLSKLILQGRIHDGETAQVTADVVKNRLVVIPNHDIDIQMVEEDGDEDMTDEDEDEDDMQIEEVD
jgi:ATP-dependent Clp protease ATP-binding subunit ClpB